MSSNMANIILTGDINRIEDYIADCRKKDNRLLVTAIHELLPNMVMESNLEYGSFHNVKMSLFLRSLALEGYFSQATELALTEVVMKETAVRESIRIKAESARTGKDQPQALEKMLEELEEGNVHNSFYYALQALENEHCLAWFYRALHFEDLQRQNSRTAVLQPLF